MKINPPANRHRISRIIHVHPVRTWTGYEVSNADLKYAVNNAADGSGTWSSITVDSSGSVGQSTSLAVADGKPMISCLIGFRSGVRFARCESADGLDSWNTATIPGVGILAGGFTSLAMVDVRPAVAFTDFTNSNLTVASNSEPDGSGIPLTGICHTYDNDTDGDGLSDAVEFNLGSLGFSTNFNDTARIQLLFDNANAAGLFTPEQLQALHLPSSLIQRDASSDEFTLTLGLEKSTTL